MAIFGINNSISEIYLMILIPMTIADKNRCFAYELTMTGTLLATVNLFYYGSAGFLAQFFLDLNSLNLQIGEVWCRVIICSLCAVSTYILWRPAFVQLKLLRKRGCKCYCRKRRSKCTVNKVNMRYESIDEHDEDVTSISSEAPSA